MEMEERVMRSEGEPFISQEPVIDGFGYREQGTAVLKEQKGHIGKMRQPRD